MELLALWVLRSDRPDDPGSVFCVTEFVAAVCPHKPLIAALLHFHVLGHQLLDALTDPDSLNREQELQLAAVRLLQI